MLTFAISLKKDKLFSTLQFDPSASKVTQTQYRIKVALTLELRDALTLSTIVAAFQASG